MKKYLILCYSKTGNSSFMAHQLARELACEVKMIRPILNSTGFILLISLFKIRIYTNISSQLLSEYQEIILIGPIWAGLVIAPLRTVLKQCVALAKPIHFGLSCETGENDKDGKCGYMQVLNSVRALGGPLVGSTAAFSTSLVKDYDKRDLTRVSDKVKITEANYSDELKRRLKQFVNDILNARMTHTNVHRH
jgi:flavodoxin